MIMRLKFLSTLLAFMSFTLSGCDVVGFFNESSVQIETGNYNETFVASDLAASNKWIDESEITSDIITAYPNLTISPINDTCREGCMVYYNSSKGIGLKFINSTLGGLKFDVKVALNSFSFTYTTNFATSKLKYSLNNVEKN